MRILNKLTLNNSSSSTNISDMWDKHLLLPEEKTFYFILESENEMSSNCQIECDLHKTSTVLLLQMSFS